jgi:hypothetical protein
MKSSTSTARTSPATSSSPLRPRRHQRHAHGGPQGGGRGARWWPPETRLDCLPFVESFGGNLDWLGGYSQNRLSWW